MPPSERRASIPLLCQAWRPFEDADYRVSLRGNAAWLLAWDREIGRQAGVESQRLCPEAQFRPAPEEDGCRVFAAVEGVEAEYWRDGELMACRWWRVAPAEADVRQWLAGHDVAGDPAVPLRWSSDPLPLAMDAGSQWLDLAALGQPSGPLERKAAVTAFLVLCGLSGAQGMDWWQAHTGAEEAKARVEAARVDRAPLAAQRDRALGALKAVQEVQAQFQQPSPMQVLQHLVGLLPPGVELKELELKGQSLRLGLTWPSQQPKTDLFRLLQAGAWMVEVREVRDSVPTAWLTLTAELAGQTPKPMVAALAASAPSGASAPNLSSKGPL